MTPKCALRAAVALLVAATVWSGMAMAEVPDVMNFQGRLFDGGGTPLSGTYSLTFRLYTVPAGGTAFWTETHPNVNVSDGLFNVLLGEFSGLTDAEFGGPQRYLGITVEADPEQSPRIQMATVAYSHRVSTVDSASGGTIIGDVLVNADPVGVNGMEIVQSGLGRGLRVAMDNASSTESGVAIVVQGAGTALGIVSSGGPAIDVIGGFGDASVNLPTQSISGTEITDGTIVTNDLADNSVTTGKIVDGTILNDDILGNEITSDRLQNEPGAVQSTYTVNYGVTNVISSVKSVSITAPSDGYALVMATATGIILHNTGVANTLNFGVSESATTLDDDQEKVWSIPSGVPTGTQNIPLAAQKIFPVTLGSHTFYLDAIDVAGSGGKLITDVTLSVVFIPTAYGSVTQ